VTRSKGFKIHEIDLRSKKFLPHICHLCNILNIRVS